MFSLRTFAASFLAASCVGPAYAQELVSGFDCHLRWSGRDGQTYCEIRDFTIPAPSLLTIDGNASPTGDIRVTGWDQEDVRVRARVIAWVPDSDGARRMADQVVIQTDGVLRAEAAARASRGHSSTTRFTRRAILL